MWVGKEDCGPGGCEDDGPLSMISDKLVWLDIAATINNEFNIAK